MPIRTSIDELYNKIGAVILLSTGRNWWRKSGINTAPKSTYSLVNITQSDSIENQITEDVEKDTPAITGEIFEQVTWGTSLLDIEVEFFRSGDNDTASDAATRFKNSLALQARFYDLWEVCGLSGSVRLTNIGEVFRQDTEPRWRVQFSVYANVTDPVPLNDNDLFDINSQTVEVTHVGIDDTETDLDDVVINNE